MNTLKNRIDQRLEKLSSENKPALVPYLTVGYPTVELTVPIATKVLSSGADMLELGIPFSDPLADGPTIQETSFIALENGTTISTAIESVREIRTIDSESPLIFMGYFNPFLRYGFENLLMDIKSAGVDGLIVPDLPTEESDVLFAECRKQSIHLIPLLAPTSTDERIESACKTAGGFIYCVSLTGVTGARNRLSSGVEELVRRIRAFTDLPVLVGFGISSQSDVDRIGQFANGAVVGSAFLDAVSGADFGKEVETASEFVRGLTRQG
ncbi:MAG: tryptophan synthase subunit alpha [Chloroflexi bacterium]|nr:tryptophan synthase subunit alpha [Chloroflexota bacterium]|tara:strand:- start:1278 stop:2081 length:804 start_codon:yes stop_codon:yes gene_type:complete